MSAERDELSFWIMEDLYQSLLHVEDWLIVEDDPLRINKFIRERNQLRREIKFRLENQASDWNLKPPLDARLRDIEELVENCYRCLTGISQQLLFCDDPRKKLKLERQQKEIKQYILEFDEEAQEVQKIIEKLTDLPKSVSGKDGRFISEPVFDKTELFYNTPISGEVDPPINELELKYDRHKYFARKAVEACEWQEQVYFNDQEPLLLHLYNFQQQQRSEILELEKRIKEARKLKARQELKVSLNSLKKFFYLSLKEDQECLMKECEEAGLDPGLFESSDLDLNVTNLVKHCLDSKPVLYRMLNYSYTKGKKLQDFVVAVA